ncbi:MAG: helix-turn-helix transcriptional regulator [Candidatus Electryoneaceae bacterium]|nr:helix-turn-helix transcriptional regulator [Candidatus Electryoneaceae bacterium]
MLGNNKFIGYRIKSARTEMGISQSRLAQLIGKSLTTIQNFESGRTVPTTTDAEKIAEVLCCDLTWLITGKEPDQDRYEPNNEEGFEVYPALQELLDDEYEMTLLQLTEEEIKALKNIRFSGFFIPDVNFYKQALVIYRRDIKGRKE